jgi:DNA-binding Lrp family transcriptional regulator
MPTPKLTRQQMQEAVDLVQEHGSTFYASEAVGIAETTLRNRLKQAQVNGIRPTKPKEEVKPYVQERLGRVHMVISDVQAKPNVSHDHLEWIANYAVEKQPDVIVQIGDWADMPSLSLYDKGKRCYEGRRYVKDCEAANYSLERFERVLEDYNRANPNDPYNPRKVLTYGNHEYRIERATMLDSALDGKLTLEDLNFKNRGWECHDFLKVVQIDGVQYSHYFISGSMGRPVTSASALLKARSGSATMGHVQRMDVAYHPQTQHIGLFAGTSYLHDEDYLGPQGNNAPRQIIMKHEVDNGRYDLMAVSLNFLKKRYS